ncbi:MAG: thiamine phosphate synthase [Nitrospirae bacterium]|nr:MAG: thiamine phosphate synthase [Nitrospirota bacterium]
MESVTLPPLYLITDRRNTRQRPLLEVLRAALEAGVRFVQLREKDLNTRDLLQLGESCLELTRAYGAKLLINDRLDLVQALHADGVHLRAESMPVSVVRRILGSQSLIGVSTHSVEEIVSAEEEGADFVVFGPIYETPSKRSFGPPLGLDALSAACRRSRLPVFAIGGLTPSRISAVKQAGAYGVATISGILTAPDVGATVREFLRPFTTGSLQNAGFEYNERSQTYS